MENLRQETLGVHLGEDGEEEAHAGDRQRRDRVADRLGAARGRGRVTNRGKGAQEALQSLGPSA